MADEQSDATIAPALDFAELNEERQYLERLLGRSTTSLHLYFDPVSGGFVHMLSNKTPGHFSKATTATCVAFLVDSARWVPGTQWFERAQTLIDEILRSDWTSAKLKPRNSFTTSFLVESVRYILDATDGASLTPAQQTKLNRRYRILHDAINASGGVSIGEYPATSFMTHKVFRVLNRERTRYPYADDVRQRVGEFAWKRLHEEYLAVAEGRPDADVFELGYAILTASLTTEMSEMTPRQRDALRHGIRQFFVRQRQGTWPRSQPLFLYPKLGNAYCYDYEFLVQLLSDRQLTPLVDLEIPALVRSARALEAAQIPIREGDRQGIGWASGHLRQEETLPEGWTTASCFHFCYLLQRRVADAIARTLFDYVGQRYEVPRTARGPVVPSDEFLDCTIDRGDHTSSISLRSVLEGAFLTPLVTGARNLDRGGDLGKDTPRSAIFYGPPGTSKTELTRIIAAAVGWPLLILDPSHLTRDGLDRVHAETHRLFTMLEACERLVVLLDEFDELVRDRDEKDIEATSRFLTTAMLPKLTALSDRKRVVYIVATNHVERFDSAIARPGRFDMIVPLTPPNSAAKRERWPTVYALLKARVIEPMTIDRAEHQLEVLTYAEFRDLVPSLEAAHTAQDLINAIDAAHENCTMLQPGPEKKNWSEALLGQRSKIRLPALK